MNPAICPNCSKEAATNTDRCSFCHFHFNTEDAPTPKPSPLLASLWWIALKGLCYGLFFAGIIHEIVYYFGPSRPTIDTNTQDYWYIVKGLQTGQYEKAIEMFDWAYSNSDDPELRYVADFYSKLYRGILNTGVKSNDEAKSLEGKIKISVYGFLNPASGLSAAEIMLKKRFGDFDKDCSIVDERYQRRIHDYWAAIQHLKYLWDITILVPPIVSSFCFVMYARIKRT